MWLAANTVQTVSIVDVVKHHHHHSPAPAPNWISKRRRKLDGRWEKAKEKEERVNNKKKIEMWGEKYENIKSRFRFEKGIFFNLVIVLSVDSIRVFCWTRLIAAQWHDATATRTPTTAAITKIHQLEDVESLGSFFTSILQRTRLTRVVRTLASIFILSLSVFIHLLAVDNRARENERWFDTWLYSSLERQ